MKRRTAAKVNTKAKRIEIARELDIAEATLEAMRLAGTAGFNHTEQTMVATAVSELARNIHRYALTGEVAIRIIDGEAKKGIEVVAEDSGPGIDNIAEALKDEFSTAGSLGLGLPGVKRLMDEFVIDSGSDRGTKITVRKWV